MKPLQRIGKEPLTILRKVTTTIDSKEFSVFNVTKLPRSGDLLRLSVGDAARREWCVVRFVHLAFATDAIVTGTDRELRCMWTETGMPVIELG